jgi:uncharacterized protein (TIGR03083 family)
MNPAPDYLGILRDYQDAFLETIPEADPAAPVRWCGDWRVEDLVVHLARVHHWAASRARRVPEPPLGDGPFDLAPHYAACAAELRATLADIDPEARAWTLLDDGLPEAEQVGTVRFWHRRQVLETLVHAWDLRTTCGLDFDPGAPAWLDCLDEVVTVMQPRQVRLGRVPQAAVRLVFDPDEGGTLGLSGAPEDAAEIVVSGPAKSLALLAWGRTTADDPSLRCTGDRSALDGVLAAGLTP